MPEQALIEIHTRSDDKNNLFYLGYLLSRGSVWSLFQVIAEDCSLGSLMLIKNNEISEILTNSANIDLLKKEMHYRNVSDVMHLWPWVADAAKRQMNTLNEALAYSLHWQQSIVVVTKTGEELLGYVNGYNNYELRLKEIDYYDKQVKTYDTIIPLRDIVLLHLFNEETCLLDTYFATAQNIVNLTGNLVELYLHFNDERDRWPWVGVIAAQNDDYLLFEKINPIGTLNSLELINRKYVYYVATKSSNLDYYFFTVALKQQMHVFDVDHIETRLQDLKSVPTFHELLRNKGRKELFTVNNQDFDASDTGLLGRLGTNTFSMNLVNNMEFVHDIEDFSLAKTISISIWSKKTAMMTSFLRIHS